MRNFTPNQEILIAADNIAVFYLVTLAVHNVSFLDTSASLPITVPSVGTFNPNAGLLIVEPPKLSNAVDRETYKITYIDPEFEKRTLFEAGLTGAAVTVQVCFVNTTNDVLSNTANGITVNASPGEYLVHPSDLLVAYAGVVDTQGYSIDPNNGTIIALVECASPMASLGLTRPFYTSKEAMRQLASTDSSFDQVSVVSSKTIFKWGKE
jgi:hypothetical protein